MKTEEAACVQCPLYANATKQLLHGDGPRDAKIMLVGEAPGRKEDAAGIPFIGDAGKLLDNTLLRAGLKRSDVFVTNAVRCRPTDSKGENRKPTVGEIKACRNHLLREVGEVEPEIIIALGNEALKSLTGMSGIKAYRGSKQDLHKDFKSETQVMPTWHPAFIIREPAHEEELVMDITTGSRTVLGGFKEIPAPYWVYGAPHLGTAPYEPLDVNGPLWSWDIETNALPLTDPELAVRFFAIDDGKNIGIFIGDDIQVGVDLMHGYIKPDRWLVGHNASDFDRMVIKEKYGVDLRTHDTQLCAHRVDEEQPLKLQDLAVKYLGVAPWKDGFDVHFWRRGPQSEQEWLDSFTYCARDTRYTRLLFVELWALLGPEEKRNYLSHNLPCSRALAQVSRNGTFVSLENTHKAIAEIDVDQRIAALLLKSHTRLDINPASHMQVRELLFSDLMLPIKKKIKHKEDASTDEEALQKLKAAGLETEIVNAILSFRENSKLLGVLRDYQERATRGYTEKSGIFRANLSSPWIHPHYSMTTTVNDRTSCFSPNLQNVPRDKRVRSVVAAPPGWVLIEADYSQLELRQAAELAGPNSKLWQEYQKSNPDVHMEMAMRLTGKPRELVTDDERSRAKPPNFAYLYYADWPTYQRIALTDYGFSLTERECRFAQDAFKEWGVDPWWWRIADELEATGCVTSIFGSKRRLPAYRQKGTFADALRVPVKLPNGRKLEYYAQLEALRMGINFSDASPSSQLVQLALAQLVGRGFYVTGYIHDAVHILVPDNPEQIEQAKATIKYDMEVTTPALVESLFGYKYSVPLPADIKVGRWWGDKAR